MKQFNFTIQDDLGIHARPAGMLVRTAAGFESSVKLTNGSKEADGKKIMSVMALAVKKGQEVSFTVEGSDEDAAVAALEGFMKQNL